MQAGRSGISLETGGLGHAVLGWADDREFNKMKLARPVNEGWLYSKDKKAINRRSIIGAGLILGSHYIAKEVYSEF